MIDSAEVKSLIDDHREFMSEWTIDNSVIGMEARYSVWGAYCQAVREMITWRGSVVFHYVAAERDRLRIEECEELLAVDRGRASVQSQRVKLDIIEARHHRADVLHNLRDAGRQFQRHYEIAKTMRVELGTITEKEAVRARARISASLDQVGHLRILHVAASRTASGVREGRGPADRRAPRASCVCATPGDRRGVYPTTEAASGAAPVRTDRRRRPRESIVRPVSARLEWLTLCRLHRHAVCWKITRTDAEQFRYTDHNSILKVEGQHYTPLPSLHGSAQQSIRDLSSSNQDVSGVLTADEIKMEDVMNGLFRKAEVEHMLVDWMYPFLGPLTRTTYVLARTKMLSEDAFEAQLDGVAEKLERRIGFVYSRTCQNRVYDTICGLDPDDYATDGTVTHASTTIPRRQFRDSALTSGDATYYRDGRIYWNTGNNAGLVGEVKKYNSSNGTVWLYESMPHDIEVGDTFTAYAGCDNSPGVCVSRFTNFPNYFGFHLMPGEEHLRETPGL